MTSTVGAGTSGPVSAGPVGTLASISIDCADPARSADFYAALLGMKRVYEAADGNVIAVSDGGMCITLMCTDNYTAPSWPGSGQLQQMHLDIVVEDLDTAVVRAVDLGARQAQYQPAPDAWRVLLDPAGHPFCLTTVTA